MNKILALSVLVLSFSGGAFAFEVTGATLDLTVFGPTVSAEASSVGSLASTAGKEILVAAHEDAIAYKNGGEMTDALQAALNLLTSAGIAADKQVDLLIAAVKTE